MECGENLALFFKVYLLILFASLECSSLNLYGRWGKVGSVCRFAEIINNMLGKDIKIYNNPNKPISPISLLVEPVISNKKRAFFQRSKINIAFSVWESDMAPKDWVKILNEFDLILVPNVWLKNVYEKSGVKKPIFTIPHFMDLQPFLNYKRNSEVKENFTFGCSASLLERKNIEGLINSFNKTFNNNPKYKLKIHSRESYDQSKFIKLINDKKIKNVELIFNKFTTNEYINFLDSLDCYVLASGGEGFSLTPREAMCLKIPCILSNNSAHIEIIEQDLCIGVDCLIKKPAYFINIKEYAGNLYYPTSNSLTSAFRKFADDPRRYREMVDRAYTWVQQYDLYNIKDYYLNIIIPKDLRLGSYNIVTKEYLQTNDKILYQKYLRLIN